MSVRPSGPVSPSEPICAGTLEKLSSCMPPCCAASDQTYSLGTPKDVLRRLVEMLCTARTSECNGAARGSACGRGRGRRAQGGETERGRRQECCGSAPLAARLPRDRRDPPLLSRGSTADRLRSQARGVYKAAESGAERYTRRERPCPCPETDFESKLLTTSAEYYRSKVAGWTAACARFSKAWEALIPAALMAYCRCLPSLKLQHLEFVSCLLASVPFVGPKKEGSAKLRQESLGVQSPGQTKASQIACCLLALCCLQRLHCGRGWVSITFNMLFLDEFRLCKRRKHQCRELFCRSFSVFGSVAGCLGQVNHALVSCSFMFLCCTVLSLFLKNIICASVGMLAIIGRTEVQGGGLRVFRVAGSVGGVGEVLA